MNSKIKSLIKTITLSLTALLIVTTAAYAIGTLTPSGTPGDDTQYTLSDIYAKLIDFTDGATEGAGSSTTPGTITASFNTLSEIYTLLEAEDADLIPENIADGVEIFGVEGTMVEGTPELEWSTDQGLMTWDTAVSTCAALTEGGASPGDWRLPTIAELLEGIAVDWIIEGDDEGDRFVLNTDYWSISEYAGTDAFSATWFVIVNNDYDWKGSSLVAKCVR